MYAVFVFLVLACSLGLIARSLDELTGSRLPKIMATTTAVALAIGLAWVAEYSVFEAFGQSLREAWMHPVLTGFALVAGAEVFTRLLDALPTRRSSAA